MCVDCLCCTLILFLNLHLTCSFGPQPMVQLRGGDFQMGIDASDSKNGESPAYLSRVKPFFISRYLVTVKEFQAFVKSRKRFMTDAESRGWSYVFKPYATHQMNPAMLKAATHHDPPADEPWMLPLIGASWKKPLGPGSKITANDNYHPVTQVSKRDATAYCFWKGMRLPTEYEWEFAARGGLKGLEYPWGDSYQMNRTNLWQGAFPVNDSGRDGFAGTNPVNTFPPQNNYGMHDVIGNVWEWTSSTYHIGHRPVKDKQHFYILKGGSHLDSRTGKTGQKARISTRLARILHYGANNVGFRCAKNVPPSKKNKKKKRPTPKPRPKYYFHSEL